LLTVCKPTTDDDDEVSNVQFTTGDWRLACAESVRDTFDTLMHNDKRDVAPIPAYNIDGTLIHPSEYSRILPNATVLVTFTAAHQYLANIKTDNYYADIVSIQTLQPAAQKRKAVSILAARAAKAPKISR